MKEALPASPQMQEIQGTSPKVPIFQEITRRRVLTLLLGGAALIAERGALAGAGKEVLPANAFDELEKYVRPSADKAFKIISFSNIDDSKKDIFWAFIERELQRGQVVIGDRSLAAYFPENLQKRIIWLFFPLLEKGEDFTIGNITARNMAFGKKFFTGGVLGLLLLLASFEVRERLSKVFYGSAFLVPGTTFLWDLTDTEREMRKLHELLRDALVIAKR